MCDILRRLQSPTLTKQQYLSSLNDFSRLCRLKKGEELFPNKTSRSPSGDDDDSLTMDDAFRW